MNFEWEFLELKRQCESTVKSISALEEKFIASRKYTSDFLAVCKELGIKTVAIQTRSELVKASKGFPFGVNGSVFASGRVNGDGWPIIWKAVEVFGIGGGCGNTDQHTITPEASAKFVDGVYTLKQGQWNRVESK